MPYGGPPSFTLHCLKALFLLEPDEAKPMKTPAAVLAAKRLENAEADPIEYPTMRPLECMGPAVRAIHFGNSLSHRTVDTDSEEAGSDENSPESDRRVADLQMSFSPLAH
jgi:hypothetical protein